MKSNDIVGYTYKADTYCVGTCIYGQLDEYWHIVPETTSETESFLDSLAAWKGIDRYDETSFDSDKFPKVIFLDQAGNSQCGSCGEYLSGSWSEEDAL